MSGPIVKLESIVRLIARISLLIYPLIAHIGIMMHQVKVPACYLVVVVYLNSLKVFSQYKIAGIVFTALGCGLLYLLIYSDKGISIIYLPPALIPGWLAFVFIGSLRTDRAIISIIAERIEGKPLDLKHLSYTRQLTALWGVVFVLMVFEASVLAVWANYEVWSWWVNIGNYIIVAVLFFGEILLRPKIIGHQVRVAQTFKALLLRSWYS